MRNLLLRSLLVLLLVPLVALGGVQKWGRVSSSGPTEVRYLYICDTTTDRDGIAGMAESETAYCKDTKHWYTWNGSAWADNAGSGSGAPTDAHYLTTQAEAGLSAETAVTAAGLALLDDNDAAAQRTTLGLGSLATASTVDTAAITDANVTYAKIQNVTTNRFLGRQTAGSGVVEELDPSNAINGTEIVRGRGRVTVYNECLNSIGYPFTVTSSTGSTAAQAISVNNRPGVARMTTAGSATGRTSPGIGVSAISVGQGAIVYEAAVNVTTLSTSAERFQLIVGLFDTQTAANQVDGVYFLYDEGGVSTSSAASANWQQCTVSNSVRTFNTTSTAVSAGTWVTLRIEINAAGTLATFYIDGTATGTTHNTNIPTGTARATGMGMLLIKSVGTTARTVDIDYVAFDEALTSSR